MKTLITITLLSLSWIGFAQDTQEFEYVEGDTTYVMKKYYMCILMAGENRSQNPEDAAEIQKAHLQHIQKMADEGKVLISGPFENGGEYRGVLIFDANSEEEVRRWVSEDPAVASGRLSMKILPWWAAKGSILK